MTIPSRHFDTDFVETLKQFVDKTPITFEEFMAMLITSVLEMRDGNRTQTARELRIPLRTFRNKLKVIESLGYDVMPPKLGTPKNISLLRLIGKEK